MTQTFRLIHLDWQPSSNLEDGTKGIYQIYGDSPIYGQNSLLYIGKSEDIKRCLDDHVKDIPHIKVQPNLKFLFARVEDETLLDIIEDTLVCLQNQVVIA